MRASLQLLLKRIQTPERNLPPWDSWFAALLIGFYIVAIFLATLIVSTLMEIPLDSGDPELRVWVNLLAGLLTGALLVNYTTSSLTRAQAERRTTILTVREALRLTPTRNTPLWGTMMLAFGLAVALDTIGFLFGVPDRSLPAPIAGISRDDTLPFLGAMLVIVVIRPFVEEILFRGLLYTTLLKSFAQLQALVLSAISFALLHYAFDPTYLWWGLIQPLVLGLVAGAARASTQSTQSAIGVHLMFGLFVILRALL